MEKGILFVVSAPSGCGKGTILGEVLKDPRFYYSVSATTRAPRPGEENGVHYFFKSREEFESLIAEGAFLEHAPYCDNYYGTLSAPIEENLNAGRHVILEIEVQGAMQVREKRPDAVFIFIAPPSIEVLRERLVNRGTETLDVIEKRVSEAETELGYAGQYDYTVINDVLDEAVADFRTIIRAEECRNR